MADGMETEQPANPPAPTPDQIESEAGRKRRRDDTADDEAERAREIRAIVRRADNRHLRQAVVPIHLAEEEQPRTAFHAAHWKSESPPCSITSLPDGAVQPRTLTLEEMVHFSQNGSAWLQILKAAVNNPTSPTGYACIVQVLDWFYKERDVPYIRTILEEALRRYCKMACVSVIAPQKRPAESQSQQAADGPPEAHGPPHAFLVTDISLEAVNDLASGHCHFLSWPENPTGVAFAAYHPDLPPPTHVGTYKNLFNFPRFTDTLRLRILNKVKAQIAERWEKIENFLIVNKASIWGGGEIEPWCLQLVQASVRLHVWEGKDRDGTPEVALSIYFLGVFDAPWLHSEWEKTLLGDELDLGEYGKITRCTGSDVFTCAICYEHDHHARICPIWNHPAWPEELRREREQQIQLARLNASTGNGSRNSRGGRGRGGAPRGSGQRGRGRGGRGGRGRGGRGN